MERFGWSNQWNRTKRRRRRRFWINDPMSLNRMSLRSLYVHHPKFLERGSTCHLWLLLCQQGLIPKFHLHLIWSHIFPFPSFLFLFHRSPKPKWKTWFNSFMISFSWIWELSEWVHDLFSFHWIHSTSRELTQDHFKTFAIDSEKVSSFISYLFILLKTSLLCFLRLQNNIFKVVPNYHATAFHSSGYHRSESPNRWDWTMNGDHGSVDWAEIWCVCRRREGRSVSSFLSLFLKIIKPNFFNSFHLFSMSRRIWIDPETSIARAFVITHYTRTHSHLIPQIQKAKWMGKLILFLSKHFALNCFVINK